MTGYSETPGNDVCWFTDGAMTVGSGSLISRFSLTSTNLAAAPATTSGLFALMVSVAAAALLVRQWRHVGRSDQADGGVLEHLEQSE